MLALGFLHGLGADHLMAIAALSLATPLGPARYARAFGLALRFAVGHALLLAVGAGLVLFFGWQIPVRFEQGGEFIGGCLLDRARPRRRLADGFGPPVCPLTRARKRRARRAQPLASAFRPPAFTPAGDSYGAAGLAGRRVCDERPSRARPVAAAVEHSRSADISGRCCSSSPSSRWGS